jgi:hypothetical protein
MESIKQTAVEWLVEQIKKDPNLRLRGFDIDGIAEQAKEMEKEQIMKTARQCHFEGVRQSAKTSQEYIDYSEQYYNETYGGNK